MRIFSSSKAFYDGVSGGLALEAFGIDTRLHYERQTDGLDFRVRKSRAALARNFVFSLKRDGKLKAVMIALDFLQRIEHVEFS